MPGRDGPVTAYPVRTPRKRTAPPRTADGLTPALQRTLDVVRTHATTRGRPPTARELAVILRTRVQTAEMYLVRLAAAGFIKPIAPYRYDSIAAWAPAERQVQYVAELLREADLILSTIQVGDRPRRDDWRRRAAAYLDSVNGAGRAVPPGGEG